MSYQSTHDSLTGLPNRAYFEQYLNERITSKQQAKLTILFLDLDKFKLVNDTMGHKAGDLLLVEVVARLQSCLRPEDMLARIGGDEFIVVLSHCLRRDCAESMATRIIDVISRPYEVHGRKFVMSASIGLARYPSDGKDVVTLLRRADAAMYSAKKVGAGTFRWYSGTVDRENELRLEIETEMRSALEKSSSRYITSPLSILEPG